MSLSDLFRKNPNPSPHVGGEYQQLIDANPYRNAQYTPSLWQNFMSMLGFRTKADAWRENMAVQAAEYDASILQKKYDEQYNDPQSQLARMRAAGLNPDIDGGSSISPGEAVGLPEDPSTPMQASGDEETLFQIGHGILQAFSTALGVVQSIQGVASTNLANRMSVIDLANQQFPNFIPSIGESADFSTSDAMAQSLEMAKMFAGNNLPSRFRRKFVDTIHGFWASAPKTKEAYDEWSQRVSSKRDYAINSQTLFDEFGGILYPMAKEIAEMNEEIFRQGQKTELAESKASEAGAQTEQAYQQELDGALMAGAQNATNQMSRDSSATQGIIVSHLKNIMDGLEKSAKEGGVKGALSSIALAIISGMYLYVQSGIHPSISRSEGSSHGEFSGPKGSGFNNSSKSSFSIGF